MTDSRDDTELVLKWLRNIANRIERGELRLSCAELLNEPDRTKLTIVAR
jgi:hypothetical protein